MDNYVPKHIPEGINNPPENFLKQFFLFTIGTVVFVGAVFFILSFFVDHLAIYMPDSWDRKLRSKFQNVESKMFQGKAVVESNYLNELILKMDPQLVRYMNLRIHILCDSNVNAFATVGGDIYVLDGFLQKVETENELVMVLGHELGHFEKRHHWRSLGDAVIMITMKMALSAAGIDTLTGVSPDIIFGKFSQKHELEADIYGINVLNQVYNHVGGYNIFFDKILTIPLDEKGTHHPGRIGSWFSTHPYPADRNKILKEYFTTHSMTESATTKVPTDFKSVCKPVVL